MAEINFTVTENGYDIDEVNSYIAMLQQEYENAVAWGEEMEGKYEELRKTTEDYGLFFTIDESNQSEVIENVFRELSATVAKIKADADERAAQIIAKANETAAGIVRKAMENSVEIRTENTTIMKNLKAISDMIAVVLEKGIQ